MKYIKTVNSCEGCHHSDHSGAFTPGGAQPICGHNETVERKGPNWKKRVIPHIRVVVEYTSTTGYKCSKIPSWCPLRKTEIK